MQTPNQPENFRPENNPQEGGYQEVHYKEGNYQSNQPQGAPVYPQNNTGTPPAYHPYPIKKPMSNAVIAIIVTAIILVFVAFVAFVVLFGLGGGPSDELVSYSRSYQYTVELSYELTEEHEFEGITFYHDEDWEIYNAPDGEYVELIMDESGERSIALSYYDDRYIDSDRTAYSMAEEIAASYGALNVAIFDETTFNGREAYKFSLLIDGEKETRVDLLIFNHGEGMSIIELFTPTMEYAGYSALLDTFLDTVKLNDFH